MFTCVLQRYQSVHQSTVFCSTEAGALPDQLLHGGAAPPPPIPPPPPPPRHHTILVCQSVLIDFYFIFKSFFSQSVGTNHSICVVSYRSCSPFSPTAARWRSPPFTHPQPPATATPTPPLYSVSSVQDGIYALGKVRMCSTPSLSVFSTLPLKRFHCVSD